MDMNRFLGNMDPSIISSVMSDPDIMRILAKPDVVQKLQSCLENPSLLSQHMSDPDMLYVLQKFQSLGIDPSQNSMASPSPIPNPWAQSSSTSSSPIIRDVIVIHSASQFRQEVNRANVVVVVDFTATWCGPCRHISPVVDKLAGTYAGKAVFLKVDVDKNRDIAQEKQISSMPTFHFYKNGSFAEEFSGANASLLEQTVDRLVAAMKPKDDPPIPRPSPYKHIPLRENESATYFQCKFDMITQKILEFNADPECGLSLAPDEIDCVKSFVATIADRTSFHRSKINSSQIDLIVKILKGWTPKFLVPVINLLRIAVVHPGMQSFLTSENISMIFKSCGEEPEAQLAALRMVCNMFSRGPLKAMLVSQFDDVHSAICDLSHSDKAPIRVAYITVLLNFSIAMMNPKISLSEECRSAKIQLLSVCCEALQNPSEVKVIERVLLVLGSLIYRDTTCKSIGQSLQLQDTCGELKDKYPDNEQINSICLEILASLLDDDN